mmetsp:Transcript_9330/g.21198  ORF Transcript_9330/g.21198 Transcript_9330/m.21198 type:complete len:292 (-) Transcript_9330:39-914(-)
MCHVGINGNLTIQAALNQNGNLRARLPAAKGGSTPPASRDELERTRGNLLAGGGDANHAALAPSTVGALECGAHHFHVARAIEGGIAAPLREIAGNHLLNGLVIIRWVDEVRAPEISRRLELVRIQVDANDHRCAGKLARLHHAQTHGTEAKHGHALSSLHIDGVPSSTQACGNATTEQARLLQGHRLVDFRGTDFGDHGVFAECRASHEVVQRLALAAQTRRAVGHHAGSLRPANRWAQVRLRRYAEYTLRPAALRRVARDDVVTRLHRCDSRSNGFDDRSRLVAKHTGE